MVSAGFAYVLVIGILPAPDKEDDKAVRLGKARDWATPECARVGTFHFQFQPDEGQESRPCSASAALEGVCKMSLCDSRVLS